MTSIPSPAHIHRYIALHLIYTNGPVLCSWDGNALWSFKNTFTLLSVPKPLNCCFQNTALVPMNNICYVSGKAREIVCE